MQLRNTREFFGLLHRISPKTRNVGNFQKRQSFCFKKALEWHEKHRNGEEDLKDKPRSGASMPIMEGHPITNVSLKGDHNLTIELRTMQ